MAFMMRSHDLFRLIIVVLSLHLTTARGFCQDPASTEVAGRALNNLQEAGEAWKADRGCVSCHQIPATLWSLSLAAKAGLAVPAEEIDAWSQWATSVPNFVSPDQRENCDLEATMEGNIDTMAALLLAAERYPEGDDPESDAPESDAPEGDENPAIAGARRPWQALFLDKLGRARGSDGSWNACGQLPLQKRPKHETNQVTTLWVTLALLNHHQTNFDLPAALAFATTGPDAESIEWYVARLLVATNDANTNPIATPDDLVQSIIDHQNEDGGWGWRIDDPSDAYGTGLVLYALNGRPHVDATVVQRGREYLKQAQTDDGRWLVPGTKSAAKNRHTETANYWGTAWAVIGLLTDRADQSH
jgi:squalene-hopene/tetraprenyl-beta-curcumene cyclase